MAQDGTAWGRMGGHGQQGRQGRGRGMLAEIGTAALGVSRRDVVNVSPVVIMVHARCSSTSSTHTHTLRPPARPPASPPARPTARPPPASSASAPPPPPHSAPLCGQAMRVRWRTKATRTHRPAKHAGLVRSRSKPIHPSPRDRRTRQPLRKRLNLPRQRIRASSAASATASAALFFSPA